MSELPVIKENPFPPRPWWYFDHPRWCKWFGHSLGDIEFDTGDVDDGGRDIMMTSCLRCGQVWEWSD